MKNKSVQLKDKDTREIANAIISNPNGYTSETLKLAEGYNKLVKWIADVKGFK